MQQYKQKIKIIHAMVDSSTKCEACHTRWAVIKRTVMKRTRSDVLFLMRQVWILTRVTFYKLKPKNEDADSQNNNEYNTIIIITCHHQLTSLTPMADIRNKYETSGCFLTVLGRQPTFSDTYIWRFISFSYLQAVVYTWEFFWSKFWWPDALPDAKSLRLWKRH